MNELKQKQLEFLNEMISFYNSENRAVDYVGHCVYTSTEKSPGCAIGRRVPEIAGELEAKGDSVKSATIFNMLPHWMQELGASFLLRIQQLHDEELNWNESGLSRYGKTIVDLIKRDFMLNNN